MKLFTLLILSSLLSVNTFAANCGAIAPRGSVWKECKMARANSGVDEYLLATDGLLFAKINKLGGRLCQVTNGVTDVKISLHPMDAASAYFVRMGDLYVSNPVRVGYECPAMSHKVIMRNVKKYSVVSNPRTTIVNTALSTSGEFTAWDNVRPVYQEFSIADYSMNLNYGEKINGRGVPYSSYVAFTIDNFGFVTKIKGEGAALIKSKDANRRFSSIAEFKNSIGLR